MDTTTKEICKKDGIMMALDENELEVHPMYDGDKWIWKQVELYPIL